jgi:hypothetical protein
VKPRFVPNGTDHPTPWRRVIDASRFPHLDRGERKPTGEEVREIYEEEVKVATLHVPEAKRKPFDFPEREQRGYHKVRKHSLKERNHHKKDIPDWAYQPLTLARAIEDAAMDCRLAPFDPSGEISRIEREAGHQDWSKLPPRQQKEIIRLLEHPAWNFCPEWVKWKKKSREQMDAFEQKQMENKRYLYALVQSKWFEQGVPQGDHSQFRRDLALVRRCGDAVCFYNKGIDVAKEERRWAAAERIQTEIKSELAEIEELKRLSVWEPPTLAELEALAAWDAEPLPSTDEGREAFWDKGPPVPTGRSRFTGTPEQEARSKELYRFVLDFSTTSHAKIQKLVDSEEVLTFDVQNYLGIR